MHIAIIAAVVLIIIILLILIGNYFYEVALTPGKAQPVSRQADSVSGWFDDEIRNWWNSMPVETMSITTHDGLKLQGYYIASESPTNRLVVLAHGYTGKAYEMAVYAKIYYEMGFDIFAPDNRGHGKSEGKVIGMGWLDRLDYLQWLDFLLSQKGSQTEILLHGHSMGGAIVSILSGENLPANVKGIISDCAYDSVKGAFTHRLRQSFKLPAFPIIPISSLICKLRAGYFFGEANVVTQVKRSKLPILYIHGNRDPFVPCKMVYNLYNATDPSLRDIWIVNGAKHIGSIKSEPDEYAARIKDFIDKAMPM